MKPRSIVRGVVSKARGAIGMAESKGSTKEVIDQGKRQFEGVGQVKGKGELKGKVKVEQEIAEKNGRGWKGR
jgi:hypothetical protein